MADPKDVSMVDVSKVSQEQAPVRRKSTLILTDEMDVEKAAADLATRAENMHVDGRATNADSIGSSGSSASQLGLEATTPQPGVSAAPQDSQNGQVPDPSVTVPVEISWTQGGEKVYVTGSFTGWRKMIGLAKRPDGNFSITLGLPVGTHRFRFIIDNELRFLDFLPTATDQMGNFVNYVEVTPQNVTDHEARQAQVSGELDSQNAASSARSTANAKSEESSLAPLRKSLMSASRLRSNSLWGLLNDDDDMGNGYFRYHEDVNGGATQYEYITDIPPIFTDPKVMELYYVAIDKQSKSNNGQQAWLHPPQLPPHLENVILNNFSATDNNSGALPIPNHVVLNHLATTSIKHNTLAVASIVRYKHKYVTQVLYAPLQ